MIQVSLVELFFHFVNVIFAVVALLSSLYVWSQIVYKPYKKIIGFYTVSIFFMALRSVCGSLARLQVSYTDTLLFNIFWAFFGAFAFIFSVYGSWCLLQWLKIYSFKGVKR